MTSLCYLYAVQARGTPVPPGVAGFDDRALFTVSHGDLEAVASELDRNTLRATEENVLRHEVVVEAVRQMGPAIPVRFGTVLRDPEAVARALGAGYSVLMDDLKRLGDKVELGLSVLWDQPTSRDSTEQGDAPDPQTPGARYLWAKLSQYRQDANLHDRARQLARGLDAELADHALERRCTVLPTPRLVMRAAYLLHPAQVKGLQDAFAELRSKRLDLQFLLSGP